MQELRRYLRRIWRASLTPRSLLTLAEAAEALPGPREQSRRWLLANVAPSGTAAGVGLYSWGDVLEAMARGDGRGDRKSVV
jgi:hypothetical protein